MIADEKTSTDDAFAERLAALDDALAAGRAPTPVPDATPTDLRARLARGAAALRDLQHLRPQNRDANVRAGSVSDGQPRTVAHASGSDVSRIGRFTILRELGRGGFGVVFLAHDPKLHREIALKVPHVQALVNSDLRERFRREALAAATLDHPNLIPVHEVDDAGPICFIASAYCPGPSLAEWLARRPAVTAVEAAAFVATLAKAVAHAHSRGILHRDLKPANIVLQQPEDRGQQTEGKDELSLPSVLRPLSSYSPKVTDFGLARIADDSERMTRTGAGLGTPAYMAPEQAVGAKEAGPAADQYALGAILYELLTGRPPARGDNEIETLRQVAECDPIAPRHLRPGLPRDLETICLKCLEKNPAKRYASATDLAEDLRRFVAGQPVLARRVGVLGRTVRWCRRKPVIAGLSAALIVVVAAGGAAVWREYRRAERERNGAVTERDRGRRLLDQVHVALGRLHDLGEDQHSLAQIFGATNQGDETRAAIRRAEELLGDPVGDPATNAVEQHYRLITALDQARLDMGTVGWETSVRAMTAIIEKQRAALAAFPNDPNLSLDLAMALEWLSSAYHDGERWAEAERYCREGLLLRQRLIQDRPATYEELSGLAHSYSRLSLTLSVSGRPAQGEEPFLEACRTYDRLIAEMPDDVIAHHDYAKHLLDGWRLYEKTNRWPDVCKLFHKLVAVRTTLVRLQPGSARRKTELAWGHFHLARQSLALGDMPTAKREYAAAKEMLATGISADQGADYRKLAETMATIAPKLEPKPGTR